MNIKQLFTTFFLLLALVAVPAQALNLQEAKKAGLVGEKPNGYLGVVKGGGDVQTLVKSVNDQRRKKYEQIAKKNNTSLKNVEALAGKKAIDKTPPGYYVFIGGWKKK